MAEDTQNKTSRERNRQNLMQHALPYLDKPLTSVTSQDAEKLFKRTLPAKGLGPFGISHAYASLRALYNYARKHKVIPPDCDPLAVVEVRKPTPAVPDADNEFVEKRLSVSRRMLEWLSEPSCPYHHLHARVLCMFLGLRRAELLGLTWDCVKSLTKANGASIIVRQELMRGEGNGWEIVLRTKTKTQRVIPLPETHRKALLALKRKQDKRGVKTQEAWQRDLIFLTETQRGWRHVSYNEHAEDWREVLTAYYCLDPKHPPTLDATEYFRPHTARRLCVSLLAEAGVPFETATDILGHKTVNMTEYYHSITKTAGRQRRRSTTA